MTDTSPILRGGCHCGAIRYEASGRPYHRTLCHCTNCRRASAAPLVGWFTVRPEDFRFVHGEPKAFRSSAQAQRWFCPDCGTQLVYRMDALDEVDVTICSLDDPAALPPEDQTWARSELPWMKDVPALPRHATTRGGGPPVTGE